MISDKEYNFNQFKSLKHCGGGDEIYALLIVVRMIIMRVIRSTQTQR